MESTPSITEHDRSHHVRVNSRTVTPVVLLAAAMVVLVATLVHAHKPEPRGARQIVRLQGHRASASGAGNAREMVLVARGQPHRFFATDWRQFSFVPSNPGGSSAAPPPRLTLQADVEILSRFANARPNQTVTILGEQRSGSADLFILALDLCPPE